MKALTVCSLVSRTIMRNVPLVTRQIQFPLSLSCIKMGIHTLDLHEAIPPNQHDMMLTDINEKGLKELGMMMDIENLSEGEFPSQAFPVEGVIYGPNNRMMINLVCRRFKSPAKSVRVWFVVNTASNCTFLAKKTIETLISPEDPFPSCIFAAIQDPNRVIECHMSPPKDEDGNGGHFEDANVLGMEAFRTLEISIEGMNRCKNSFRLVKQ